MLKVQTQNLWYDADPWPQRRELLRGAFDRLDADLVGLQEVLHDADGGQLAELFGHRLPTWHTLHAPSRGAAARHGGRDFGNAVVSRWPIAEHRVVELPDGGLGREPRIALITHIDSPHGRIVFAVTHLNWRLDHGFVREQQVVALLDALGQEAAASDFPPILVGDFNAEPDASEIRFILGLQALAGRSAHMRDAWRSRHGACAPGHTWSRDNVFARWALEPDRRIDYVFVGPPDPEVSHHGHVLDCRVVCNEAVDGIHPSDHFGVLATLATGPVTFDEP